MRHATPAVLLAIASVALAACFERTKPTVETAVRPVIAVRVALAPDQELRAYDGVIRPRREADLGFRTGGRIVAREVDLGSRVAVGQVLARLDPADLALSVRSAEADLASARAQATQAATDAARSRTLTRQGWVAAATDEVKQASTSAATERVASALASLALARNRLEYAVLRAPHAGIVTALLADPGTVVAEGQTVLRLAEQGTPEVEIALPEAALATASADGAMATFWARPDARLPVRLRELSPAADRGMRTFVAHYALPDPPDWVVQGMTATVHLPATPNGDNALVAMLPASALADRGGGPMVWVVLPDGGIPQRRPVTVRRIVGNRAVISGVAQDELVVAVGVQKLDPAAHIRVADIRPVGE